VTPIYLGVLRKNPIGTFWTSFVQKKGGVVKYQLLSGVVNISCQKMVVLGLGAPDPDLRAFWVLGCVLVVKKWGPPQKFCAKNRSKCEVTFERSHRMKTVQNMILKVKILKNLGERSGWYAAI